MALQGSTSPWSCCKSTAAPLCLKQSTRKCQKVLRAKHRSSIRFGSLSIFSSGPCLQGPFVTKLGFGRNTVDYAHDYNTTIYTVTIVRYTPYYGYGVGIFLCLLLYLSVCNVWLTVRASPKVTPPSGPIVFPSRLQVGVYLGQYIVY